MKTHRNSNTENPEQKKHQLNHDRSELRHPGICIIERFFFFFVFNKTKDVKEKEIFDAHPKENHFMV